MVRLRRILPFVMAAVLLAGLGLTPLSTRAAARSPGEVPATRPPFGSRVFPETGFAAVNSFRTYWERTPNALFTLGLPISQPFIEQSFTNPGEYYRVQYFERAVLEEHPENNNQFYILGRLMGSQLSKGREAQAPFQPVADPGDGSYDSASKHTLRNSPAPFRGFWQNNGGLGVFGRPLSEQFQETNAADGKVYWVQYFERQRMEWHPDEPNPQYRILLGLLGNEYRNVNHTGNAAFVPGQQVVEPASTFAYGYNAILYGQGGTTWQDRPRALQLVKISGFGWVRQQIRWKDLHDRSGQIFWAELDNIVDDANRAGVKLLLSIVRAPAWATPDGKDGMPAREHFSTFNFFMGEMAKRYKGKVGAYEIWNEQNLAYENGGRVASASYYMDMLVGASQAIKVNDPAALIVSGGPSSTETNNAGIALSDITFLRQMFQDPRFKANVDIVGAHPGGASNPPDTFWPDRPGPGPNFVNSREFYFRRVEDVRALMVQNGLSDMKVWVTEFGWATRNTSPGYEFGNQISYQKQAEYIVRAYRMARTDYRDWMGGMFLWQLNFAVSWRASGNELHEQASYGVLNGDWTPRPSFTALQGMPKD